ncbi:MAG TPA: ATP-binding protein [Bacillota bacterium]
MSQALQRPQNLDLLSEVEKDQFLKVLFDDAPDSIVYLAGDFTIRFANRVFMRQLGLTEEQVIGKPGKTVLPGFQQLSYLFQKSSLTRQASRAKFHLQLPDSNGRGFTYWKVTVHPLVSAEELTGWLLVLKDTTKQVLEGIKRAEESKERKQRVKTEPSSAEALPWQLLLKTVLDYVPLGIAVYTGANCSLYWANPIFQDFLKLSEQARQNAGVLLENHLPYTDNLQFDEVFYQVLTERRPCLDLKAHFRQAPDTVWQCSVVPLETNTGNRPDVMITVIKLPEPATSITGTEKVTDVPFADSPTNLGTIPGQPDETLVAMAKKLYEETNLVDILKTSIRYVVQTLRADEAGIILFNKTDGELQVIYDLWLEDSTNRIVNIKEMPNIKKAVTEGKPYFFTAEEATGKEKDWFQQPGISGCLAVPLVLEDNCIGLLLLYYNSQNRKPSETDLNRTAWFSEKCASVIERAYTQLEKTRLLISERRARSRAERQAAELSALLQSLKDGVLVLDASGKIVLRNRMERLITRIEDEQGLSYIDYSRFRLLTLDGKPVQPPQLPGNRLLRGETLNDTEYLIEHSDGTRLNVISNGSVVRGEDGQVVLAILVTRDVTRLRILEEIREDFIRTVSHDLRNPLTVVSARSQLLQRRLLKHGLQTEAGEAEVIYTSSRQMTEMIQEMFDSYRLESNNFKLNKRLVDLASIMREISLRFGTEAERKRIRVEISAGNYRTKVDPERLERAIINLITNALKYSPIDRPVIVKLSSDTNQIMITVTDFGIGIAPQDLHKVFQRYFRSQTVKETSGLGLGLYIVKLIVEAHGGSVTVESEVNQGSTFGIILPVEPEEPFEG